MASNSSRKSGSSGRSSSRSRTVIGGKETVRVRYAENQPQVQAERKRAGQRGGGDRAGTRVPKVGAASRKVSAQKRDDRDKRRKSISRRNAVLPILGVIAAAGVVWGLVALWQAPLFTVDTVQVTGVHRLTQYEVLALAAVPSDATLLRLPEQEIISRIRKSPWVSEVRLERRFPHALSVVVTERTPAAFVDVGAQGMWMVSGDGHWIIKRGSEPTGALLPIRDVPGLRPSDGAAVTSQELRNALSVIAGLSGFIKRRTQFVSAASVEKTMLVLKNQVRIFVGSAEDIAKKDLIARDTLAREKNVVYINVRTPERTSVRSLSPAN
jgi:cell division protein FtsQ